MTIRNTLKPTKRYVRNVSGQVIGLLSDFKAMVKGGILGVYHGTTKTFGRLVKVTGKTVYLPIATVKAVMKPKSKSRKSRK